MTRGQIRYALFRCKAGTPEQTHLDVLNKYQGELVELGMTIDQFTTDWDVSKEDSGHIVTGHLVRHYNRNVPLSIYT